MNPAIETILAEAVRAPSGDNTQPWRFDIDPEQGRIAFHLDETRDPSPMNSGQRMARIAIGAAIENVLRTAQKNGWEAEMESAAHPALAAIRLHGAEALGGDKEDTLAARVTNRRLYDGRALENEVFERLRKATPALESGRTHWIVGADRLHSLADLIGRADALMFGEPSMRKAFLKNVRFDRPATESVEQGLSLASLELSAPDRLALRLMPHFPNWLFKFTGGGRVFAAKARSLIASASGLCLIVVPDETAESDLLAGRCMQRAWLALTAEGMAAQPMMSLPVLENALANATPAVVSSLGRERLEELGREFRRLAPEIGTGRPAFLLRFGFAPAPSGRTGRLPWNASLLESQIPVSHPVGGPAARLPGE